MIDKRTREKGISLIALIITIIVIIILAAIVLGVATSTPETANKAKFLGDISEVQQAVSIKRTENLLPLIKGEEADKNSGFTKITFKRNSLGESKDGWVVNLDNIGIKNSTLGNGYNAVVENTEIIFGGDAPDIYIYDDSGEVFYAKGFKDGDKTIYSKAESLSSGQEDVIAIVEPDSSSSWDFDEATGKITGYRGPEGNEVPTLVVPNHINGKPVIRVGWLTEYGRKGPNNVNIIISNGITRIEEFAFAGSAYIATIQLPDTLKIIGRKAFVECTSLTSISIPSNVTNIGEEAFMDCSNLQSINLPNGLLSMGDGVFFGCSNMTSITIPNSVTSIGGSAFNGCRNLTSITIPDSVTSIGGVAFYGCSGLTSITIPDSVTSIGGGAFANCSGLTSVKVIGKGPDDFDNENQWGVDTSIIQWNQ